MNFLVAIMLTTMMVLFIDNFELIVSNPEELIKKSLLLFIILLITLRIKIHENL